MAHFVLFETGGNQRFIFATNKLAENLGASQMIWDAGVRLILQEVERRTGRTLFAASPKETREYLRCEPQLGDGENDIEVVTAASGKAILLVNEKETGLRLIYEVTKHCLQVLPGVDLRGVVGRCFNRDEANLDDEMRAVHGRLAALSGTIPGPEFRFLRLPVIAACATSNLPASHVDDPNVPGVVEGQPQTRLRSEVSWQKRIYANRWAKDRLWAGLRLGDDFSLPRNLEQLDRLQGGIDWLAVIHVDGNGIGAVFQDFGARSQAGNAREYITLLRAFSLSLDECTEKAAVQALVDAYGRKVRKDHILAAVPLVLGGDDLTMVCDGCIALRMTHTFLQGFASEARANEDIRAITRNGGDPITASAGVAIVKPHFPFHLAYELAEALLRSAKHKKPDAAIDFLVHYDASGSDLGQIREKLKVGNMQLYARPYRIAGDDGWAKFAEAVKMLNGESKPGSQPAEEETIPRSLLHELRSALFLGPGAGEKQLQWALERRGAGDRRLREMLTTLHGGEILFRPDGRSALLDVLEAQEFWR